MTQKDPIYKIIREFENYKDTNDDLEMIADINTIDGMIKGEVKYNQIIVDEIKNKYDAEINVLILIKRRIRGLNSNTNSNVSLYQYLLNLQHTLVRIQVTCILKRKGKKMAEEDLINNDNEHLYNKFVKAMND